MPKIHEVGNDHFFQFIDFPVQWGWKFVVRGWTQELQEPYRYSEPFIFRLPSHKAFVFGKWIESRDEETALNAAVERRDVTYDDFTEEAGWIPAPEEGSGTSSETS